MSVCLHTCTYIRTRVHMHTHSGSKQWSGWLYQTLGFGVWETSEEYWWWPRYRTKDINQRDSSIAKKACFRSKCVQWLYVHHLSHWIHWLLLFLLVDVWTLAFSVDSRYLATGSHNGKINLFSVEEGRKQTALDTRGKFIMSIAYVSDPILHTVATASYLCWATMYMTL